MTRSEFTSAVAEKLRDSGARKPVHIPKNEFTISDMEGNVKRFVVKRRDKNVFYTVDDVTNFLGAFMEVIKDILKRGDTLSIRGFGTISLKYRKPRKVKNVMDGEEVECCGRYIPKMYFSKDLKLCGLIYGMSLEERLKEPEPIFYDEIDDDIVSEEVSE